MQHKNKFSKVVEPIARSSDCKYKLFNNVKSKKNLNHFFSTLKSLLHFRKARLRIILIVSFKGTLLKEISEVK